MVLISIETLTVSSYSLSLFTMPNELRSTRTYFLTFVATEDNLHETRYNSTTSNIIYLANRIQYKCYVCKIFLRAFMLQTMNGPKNLIATKI